MTTMDWLIVAVAALVVAYAIYQRFFAGYRPLLRKALKQWQLGNRDAAHDSFQLLVPRLKGRFALRDLATVRLYLAAFFWERGLPRAMAEQARR
ncbi:MAG TPA: hypothetical protein VEI97_05660, partial [bacterium]|nr:hypothetical protein [bacterium]